MDKQLSSRGFPWQELKYLFWFPLYLLLFLLLERLPFQSFWYTQLPIDAAIPFCEWFAIPYCLWYPFLICVGLYLLLQDIPAYRRYMKFLAVTFFASELIWLLIPNAQSLRPAVFPRENLLSAVMDFIYSIDTNTNVFPSVHVVGSIGAALAVLDAQPLKHNRFICWGAVVLAALISVSIVFVKQHALLDLLGGIALSLPAAVWVYTPRKHKKTEVN